MCNEKNNNFGPSFIIKIKNGINIICDPSFTNCFYFFIFDTTFIKNKEWKTIIFVSLIHFIRVRCKLCDLPCHAQPWVAC